MKPPALSETLLDMIGKDCSLSSVGRALREYASDLKPATVGAYQINCSDESERENVEAFHEMFVSRLLPELKYWNRSAFRTVNLGGRYEPGAIPIAESHFATPESAKTFKLMVVKVNSHASVVETYDGPVYGYMPRYERQSVYCGAIHALLEGERTHYTDDLRRVFHARGVDRLTALKAPSIDPTQRALFAAIVNCRMQGELVMSEIVAHEPATPTLYLLVCCVTLNRTRDDTELVCGLALLDRRGSGSDSSYVGLGDNPSAYRISYEFGSLSVTDEPGS